MRKFGTALFVGLVAIGTSAVAAGPVNVRQANQERRIDAGERSGKLTHAEQARLDAEQRSIKRLEAQLKARHGGHLTAADKRLIHSRQEAANRHILAQKQDSQRGRNKLKL
ncbi:hypothetical protein Q4F19_16335 [Sphingomonas sp. BIUV-7]|uniref:Uncharacterized protein n=1 Tax=Sphingomonas natans TaxID=3063330 RepID=A0ABT8YC96_9SPHN|nr:hypothetical protein [Sphingomonas sp. BIUV-7]MDO6415959.1 hypothetical protein [Sphingomonas sp. BIUV-7]